MTVRTPTTEDGELDHFVSGDPFDPNSVESMTAEQERYYMASQWQMMWWKFRRHRLAVISGVVLAVFYFSILISEFLAPYHLHSRNAQHIFAPPQGLHLLHEGEFVGPFVYGLSYRLNMENLKREYTPDTNKVQRIRYFCSGDKYKFWGLFEASFHLICPAEGGTLFLLGTDRLGRDMLSRVVYGTRISLTVGLIGISISFVLGLFFGGVSGYFGGWWDTLTSAAHRNHPILSRAAALDGTVSRVAGDMESDTHLFWNYGHLRPDRLDRIGPSRPRQDLSLREEDFATAAQLMGASSSRIIGRHLMPSFMSHLIASATLSIPSMILGETALSFLGLGLRPPITSWGVLLNEAQNINVVALYPWLMLPVAPVIIVVLTLNFFGDGLRDAADPYR